MGKSLDLKFLLRLETEIAAAYTRLSQSCPPTIRQFITHGEL
jgi:hypothetical protein